MAIIFKGERIEIEGVESTNHIDDNEPEFRSYDRNPHLTKPVKWIVLHETNGNTAAQCKQTLARRKLGVQLIIDYDGHVSCHGDLYRVQWHGNQLNLESVGIEIVNPYNPVFVSPHLRDIFCNTIPAEFWTWIPRNEDKAVKQLLKAKKMKSVPRAYITPTDEQITALERTIPVLCEVLEVPLEFPTINLSRRNPRIKRWKQKAKPDGYGIVAHRDYASHADGRYPLEHMYARTEKYDILVTRDYDDSSLVQQVTYDVTYSLKGKTDE